MRRILCALLLSALPLSVSAQEEQEAQDPESSTQEAEPERERADWEGVWSLYGASLGRHLENEGNGYSVGIELSDVHLFHRQLWYGYYADLRYSSLARGVDLSVGVEAGISVIGVDLGLYARIGKDSAIGFRGRGCISALAVVSICGGGGFTTEGGFAEASLLLKYGRRRDREEEPATEPNPETEEADTPAPDFRIEDERMFILEAPFQGGVDAAEGIDAEANDEETDEETDDEVEVEVEEEAAQSDPDSVDEDTEL